MQTLVFKIRAAKVGKSRVVFKIFFWKKYHHPCAGAAHRTGAVVIFASTEFYGEFSTLAATAIARRR